MSGLIYGYIESIGLRREDEAVESHNADVLASLPAYGSYICKEMFTQLPRRRPITYYAQLIHFATEPKELWCMDSAWIEQFEGLLQRLWWSKAELIETSSGQRFQWCAAREGNSIYTEIPVVSWQRNVFASYHDLPQVSFEQSVS